MTRPAETTRGLTLIELIAAMAVFALVAAMGAQALSGMLRQRDGLITRSQQAQRMEEATALLRADLSALVPMLFYPPGQSAPLSAARQTPTGFELSIAGQPRLDLQPSLGFHRVIYRLDQRTGQLWRRTWPTLVPADLNSVQPEVLILDNVKQLSLRSHWGASGWRQGLYSTQTQTGSDTAADSDGGSTAAEVYSSVLPLAIEVTLTLDGLGTIRLVESLQ